MQHSSSSSSSVMACAFARRKSVDVGGLSLALQNRDSAAGGSGRGWGGWEEEGEQSQGPKYAELLTEMRTHTLIAVSEGHDETARTTVQVPSATRLRLIESLDSWNFEPHKLPEEELVECTLILFETLFRVEGMAEAVKVSIEQIPPFVRHLRQIYRSQNSYHNFQHAVDVLQATQTFLRSAGMVPNVSILLREESVWRPDLERVRGTWVECLSLVDLFTTYVAAIGHDVGHPGFSNMFMKNAKTPLSAVYDDKSALEQMHCTLLLHVMRYHGMSHLLEQTSTEAVTFRKMLVETVLATDMSVHMDFMKRFEEMVGRGLDGEDVAGRRVLLCQALIKCADISNPSRPHWVSEYWANALMEEWSGQAWLERDLQLPATVKPSEDASSAAKGQVFFINGFAKPLLELTARAIPEMDEYARQCKANLEKWSGRIGSSGEICVRSVKGREDYSSAFPLSLPRTADTGSVDLRAAYDAGNSKRSRENRNSWGH